MHIRSGSPSNPTPTGPPLSKGTPRRGVRVEDALWLPALTIAKQRGENLSDIIRAALHDYINKHQGEK